VEGLLPGSEKPLAEIGKIGIGQPSGYHPDGSSGVYTGSLALKLGNSPERSLISRAKEVIVENGRRQAGAFRIGQLALLFRSIRTTY
jgi:hypothetical protein